MKASRKLGRKSLGKMGAKSRNILLAGIFALGGGLILPLSAEAAEAEAAATTTKAEESSASETPAYSLETMIVTAQRVDTKDLDTPAIVEVYDEKKIEETGAANAFDVLKNTLGVTIHSQGFNGTAMGTMTSKIMIRGVERGTLVLVNGVPMNMDGKYNLEDIPAESIERIEVVKGGGSVLYGSEATGGVINIITKKTFKNKFSISAGNYGKERYSLSLGADRFNIVLGLENRGAASPMSRPITGAGNGYDYEKGERKSLLWNFKIMDGLTFTHAYSKNEHRYLQRNFPVGNKTQMNDYKDTDNNFFLTYDKAGWKATISYGMQEKETDYTKLTTGKYFRGAWRKGHNTNVNVQKNFDVGPNGKDKILVGASFQREDMDVYSANSTTGVPQFDSNMKRDYYSIYFSYDWMMNDRSNLLVNLRETWANNTQGKQTNLADNTTKTIHSDNVSKFTPEIEYMYHFNKESTFYAKVGQSFRMPNLTQIYGSSGRIYPSYDLKPEQGTHYEVGYKRQEKKITWRAALFHFQIKDAIEAKWNNARTEVSYNNTDIRNTGIELSVDMKHDENWTSGWGIMYHNPQAKDLSEYQDSNWHDYHGKIQLKGNINYKYKKFTGTLDMNFVGDRTSQSKAQRNIKPQFFTDLHLTYSPEANQKFFVHLNNIFNRQDITTNADTNYFTLGRNFMAGYEVTF
ncbi:MAG: TonB-dependent receptor [Selenomonadaceae bacterium]|nr:TonB-dependent receptor [Selenomonadaceae bacterium]